MKFAKQIKSWIGGIRPAPRQKKRGVAAAELAVCLPVVVLIVVATIEACSALFLKQSLTVAAYEGARTALADRTVKGSVETAINQVLKDRKVKGGTITLKPANITNLKPGDFIDVTVSAPCNLNSVVPTAFYRGKTLKATASMMVEE
jgi:Flp pilus assembly protein TadG